MFMLLVFVSALTAARADCDACIQGICHSKKTLIEGFNINNQLAIDRTNNILYVEIKDHQTIAFFLDEAKMRSVDANYPGGLTVDQETQDFYTSQTQYYSYIYAYGYEQGAYKKKLVLYLDGYKSPARLRYEDTLYTINQDGSCAYYDKTSKSFHGYSNLENFKVTDLVNVRNATEWFFTSANKLYRFNWDINDKKSWTLISEERHVLSIGKYGDVYFGDVSARVIYKLDRKTKEMVKYGDYMNASLEDFVFDKDENIVFLDHDGNVVSWVSTGKACTKPHLNSDLSPGKSFLVELVRGGDDAYNFTYIPKTTLDSKELYEVIEV
ncbi:uncharacterized protein LOC134669819 [Cydia fagiglandana]|uniref:uncharacterized protein LOC134669819 n=1 Tax=Cydia fagiglandana TaxID=1458189 RepID=UPI002FEE3C84